MPTPPATSTTALFSTRSLVPRSHTTIAPATAAGSSEPGKHSWASVPALPSAGETSRASTSGAVATSRGVTDAPT